MKHFKKLLITLTAAVSTTALPLVAASCNNEKLALENGKKEYANNLQLLKNAKSQLQNLNVESEHLKKIDENIEKSIKLTSKNATYKEYAKANTILSETLKLATQLINDHPKQIYEYAKGIPEILEKYELHFLELPFYSMKPEPWIQPQNPEFDIKKAYEYSTGTPEIHGKEKMDLKLLLPSAINAEKQELEYLSELLFNFAMEINNANDKNNEKLNNLCSVISQKAGDINEYLNEPGTDYFFYLELKTIKEYTKNWFSQVKNEWKEFKKQNN
ncbi:variable surface lipoprotein [Metamycoplasma hominis]|uniref:variable surface lipoprotein n=2 Tax=Metamycoplasma hominis TaxID=2098 RepID=UPI00158DCBD5|nr:variable surface lipoprotein [Metamycoplasma hominis]QKX40286.1 variable surface lipoprotein [Metamycoplasma hominis]